MDHAECPQPGDFRAVPVIQCCRGSRGERDCGRCQLVQQRPFCQGSMLNDALSRETEDGIQFCCGVPVRFHDWSLHCHRVTADVTGAKVGAELLLRWNRKLFRCVPAE